MVELITMFNNQDYDSWFCDYFPTLREEILNYISVDTSFNKEDQSFAFLEKLLQKYDFDVAYQSYHPSLLAHPANTPSDNHQGTNIQTVWAPSAGLDTKILFNSHIDVVPDNGETSLFQPSFDDEFIYGRGACDTKGNLFLLLGALAYMKAKRIEPKYRVLLDLVSGEEIGGNGTLSTVMYGLDADCVIVFEPTDLCIHRGHRGCLTCEIEITGKAVHMGGDEEGISAIKMAMLVIREMELLEKEMLEVAKNDPAFSIWKRPLQINIGKIVGGEWPGSVPEKCTLTLNIGFLPPSKISDIEQLIQNRVCQCLEKIEGVQVSYDFSAGLRNKAYLIPNENTFLQRLSQACASARNLSTPSATYGWRASCDARHYNQEANIDAVIFGAGSLKDAHSAHEKIEIKQIQDGIKTLVLFLGSEFF